METQFLFTEKLVILLIFGNLRSLVNRVKCIDLLEIIFLFCFRVITPSQVLIYLYDSYQLSNAVGRSPAYWDSEMCRFVLAYTIYIAILDLQ